METLRKRIFYKATHRGMRETDKIFGEFLIKNLNSLDKNLLGDLDKLLDLADVDLLNWILGREEVPKEFDNEMFRLLVSFKESL